MTTTKASVQPSNIVPIRVAAPSKESERKWGVAVMQHGSFILPSIMLRAQARILVTPQEMMVLLHLVEHWWTAERKVFPSKETLAERVGLSEKQIQRYLKSLEDKKLITRKYRTKPGRGKTSSEYDLSGLVKKLKEIEPDFAKAKQVKAAAAKPGGLRAAGL